MKLLEEVELELAKELEAAVEFEAVMELVGAKIGTNWRPTTDCNQVGLAMPAID